MLKTSLISGLLPSRSKLDSLRDKMLCQRSVHSDISVGAVTLLVVASVLTWQSCFSKNWPPRPHYFLVGDSQLAALATPTLEPDKARAAETSLDPSQTGGGIAQIPPTSLMPLALPMPPILLANEPPSEAALVPPMESPVYSEESQARRGSDFRSSKAPPRKSRTAKRPARTRRGWSLQKSRTPVASAKLIFACVVRQLSSPPVLPSRARTLKSTQH